MAAREHQFVVDEQGQRVAVLVPIAEYEQLMESAGQPTEFWATTTLQSLAAAQGVTPIHDPGDLMGHFWPDDESVDDFLDARRSWQHNSKHDNEAEPA